MHKDGFPVGIGSEYVESIANSLDGQTTEVAQSWRRFLQQIESSPLDSFGDNNIAGLPNFGQTSDADLVGKMQNDVAKSAHRNGIELDQDSVIRVTRDSVRALMLIRAYRIRGHLIADLDPLNILVADEHPELDPLNYGFTPDDWQREIFLDFVLGMEFASLETIIRVLKRTYCSTVGYEFMHINEPDQKLWMQQVIEGPDKSVEFTDKGKIAILRKLQEAESFERFLDVRHVGTKRFGLEGAESLIPALEQIIKRGGTLGLKEIVIGMAHRGRLNVLSQVMGKQHRAIFNEFMGGTGISDEEGSGDVKYHLGASSDRDFDGNSVHISLAPNPSHLEIVDPIVLGRTRAKQDQHGDMTERRSVLPLLIHGDAAFSGQGVVAECLGLSGLTGYRTGGSIHFVINNQIGFTTSPRFSRSSPYPSDLAKFVGAPIFHCNGDDPEAVVHCARVATDYRMKFGKPVVIDMFCYRRFGHNEADDPMFTQPKMYRVIKKHPTTPEIYRDKLIANKVLDRPQSDGMIQEFRDYLESEYDLAKDYAVNAVDWLDGHWGDIKTGKAEDSKSRRATAYPVDRLRELGSVLTTIPEDFAIHKTLKRILKVRWDAISSGSNIDWSTAEALAFASLLDEDYGVRLSGQDSERGTFSQRHSVWNDQENEDKYRPLQNIREGQGRFEVINSMLSEEAVLGFDYGYSLTEPNCLTLWEAQFGDFANGAQVVIDQFLSGGERKWLRMSGLVVLLPHGYEGMGPEHSSARLERFLQLCAEDNMQVANCTSPANFFHLLRRQLKRDTRKALIVMAPKSLLRHKKCVSKLVEMGEGSSFHRVLWDLADDHDNETKLQSDHDIKRLLICSGKVYYDLYAERERIGCDDAYILRIEQLYPVPLKSLITEMSRFPNAEIVWVQEEPRNMGGWSFMRDYLEWLLLKVTTKSEAARYVGRPASASTAAGNLAAHNRQLQTFLSEAFDHIEVK